jgi:hypothetical protein
MELVWMLQERVLSRYLIPSGSKQWDHLQAVTRYNHLNPSLTSGPEPVAVSV